MRMLWIAGALGAIGVEVARRRARGVTPDAAGPDPTAAGRAPKAAGADPKAAGRAPKAAGAKPASGAAPALTAQSHGKHGEVRPFMELRPLGLRIEPGLRKFGAGKDYFKVRFEAPAQLNNDDMRIYGNVTLGAYSFLRSGTVRHVRSIGRYTSIGPGVILGEGEHPLDWLTTSATVFDKNRWYFHPPSRALADRVVVHRHTGTTPRTPTGKVTIGNDVWIGANVMVRRGVTIGDGAVVAAGAFVNRDVPPYTIVGGLPAKKIGERFDPELVERLLASRWWEFDLEALVDLPFDRPVEALDELARREADGRAHRSAGRFDEVIVTRHGWADFRPGGTSRL